MDLTRFEGLTIEDLEAAIVAMKEAEEAKAREEEMKAEAYLAGLRVNMLDAAINNHFLLGPKDTVSYSFLFSSGTSF